MAKIGQPNLPHQTAVNPPLDTANPTSKSGTGSDNKLPADSFVLYSKGNLVSSTLQNKFFNFINNLFHKSTKLTESQQQGYDYVEKKLKNAFDQETVKILMSSIRTETTQGQMSVSDGNLRNILFALQLDMSENTKSTVENLEIKLSKTKFSSSLNKFLDGSDFSKQEKKILIEFFLGSAKKINSLNYDAINKFLNHLSSNIKNENKNNKSTKGTLMLAQESITLAMEEY